MLTQTTIEIDGVKYPGDVAHTLLSNELSSAKAENVKLKDQVKSLQEYAAEEVADCDALRRKLYSLAPHETCGCAWDHEDDVCEHHSPVVTKLKEELAACKVDAERYKWLIESENGDLLYELIMGCFSSKEHFDAAIDSAMKDQP